MKTWQFLQQQLQQDGKVLLLYVVDNAGSSPGRAGFMMGVAVDGSMHGTIGGGIMEHKLVELAKTWLGQQPLPAPRLIPQFHDKKHPSAQSGMICSGRQTIAFIPLTTSDLPTIDQLLQAPHSRFSLTPAGLSLVPDGSEQGWQQRSESDWQYTATPSYQPHIHIIGAGHTGLALSQLMHFLGFRVSVYDDRTGLNTWVENTFADHKQIIDYNKVLDYIRLEPTDYVVIMTIGYRDDKQVLQQLLSQKVFYLGMLGSKAKVRTLLDTLAAEGYATADLQRIFTPIGLDIGSQTTQEIAVSIAAQIIQQKNKR